LHKKEPLADCIPAIWYGVTPVVKDRSGVGLSIQSADGHIYRFRLAVGSAEKLVSALRASLDGCL
jgi:hypothetical protein